MGEIAGAKADLEESVRLVPNFTQSLVKIASVHMEQGDPQQAFKCFDEAVQSNSKDPDVYYHRGQGEFIVHCSGVEAVLFNKDLLYFVSPIHYERVRGCGYELHDVVRT